VARALYITQDGITDHIGQAQIAPYLTELARLGHDIHVVSAEKPGRDRLRSDYRETFRGLGIGWSEIRYANWPPLVSSYLVMERLLRAASEAAREFQPDFVHCRSYLPLSLGVKLKRRFGIRYLADFRDFWADVGVETKRFKFVYRYYRRIEPRLLGCADHIVTLTNRAVEVLMDRHPQAVSGRREGYSVIPCCADFRVFDPARASPAKLAARRRQLEIGEVPVLLYLGSIGPDYLLEEMFNLFREMQAEQPDAIFLLVANNGLDVIEAAARRHRIPPSAIRMVSAERTEIIEYLALATCSVVFIRPTLSKAACSPTKVGELLAAGVPVIANEGVGDLGSLLSPEKNSSIAIADFTPETLRRAVRFMLSLPSGRREAIRSGSSAFSLAEGVRLYDEVYRQLASAEGGEWRGQTLTQGAPSFGHQRTSVLPVDAHQQPAG